MTRLAPTPRPLCLLIAVALSTPCHASADYPRPRLARTVTPARVAAILSTVPPARAVQVPLIDVRPWTENRAYKVGDAVSSRGNIYYCVQAHTPPTGAGWEPAVVPALWRLIRSADDPPAGLPAWRQPLGAHDAYQMGDLVTHNGSTWRSMSNNNVWEPGVYGWIEQ